MFLRKAKADISMFESLAGYAPAYGMIGTIMGLIQVLANMESPEQMASAIAVAFITTLYGVVIANLLCLPTANKLRSRLKSQLMEKEMIVEGICSIRNGQNPKMLREKLSTYLANAPNPPKKAVKKGKEAKANAKTPDRR
jgi:chemotaxis protein MotA